MRNGLIMYRRNLFETRRQLFQKNGFVLKSCFLYTKLNCHNDSIKNLVQWDSRKVKKARRVG